MSYECPTIQRAMAVAYDRWRDHDRAYPTGKWSQDQFLRSCSDREIVAVTLGNFNYQVENGGFGQWYDNRYASRDTHRRLLTTVEAMGAWARAAHYADAATPIVVSLLKKFARAVRNDWDPINDSASVYGRIEAADLDRPYYAINAEFMNLAEAWFAVRHPEPQPAGLLAGQLSHREALRHVLDALGALTNPNDLHAVLTDSDGWACDDLARAILAAAERPEPLGRVC